MMLILLAAVAADMLLPPLLVTRFRHAMPLMLRFSPLLLIIFMP